MPGVDLWDNIDPFTEEQLWRVITSTKPIGELPLASNEGVQLTNTRSFQVQGKMIGGNLTVFTSLLGTPYQPSFRGTIPFLEEIDEKPRKLDAHFAQLRLAGAFDQAKAILLGQFTNCDTDADAQTLNSNEVFSDYLSKLKIPILTNLPFGHEKRMWTLPYGSKLGIEVKKGVAKIAVLQSPLE